MYEIAKKAEKTVEIIEKVIVVMTTAGALITALSDLIETIVTTNKD